MQASFLSVFPAYAGVILLYTILSTYMTCVPRVCGGDPIDLT